MSSDFDLPLFNWCPATCQVVPFPHSKRIGKARRVAQVLSRKNGHDATTYWNSIIQNLKTGMDRVGIEASTVTDEIQAFTAIVQGEMHRQSMKGKSA